jgi:hypothetical protein
MSEHEDILMGFDAVTDRLNDAILLVRATRESYLDLAQKHASLRVRLVNVASRWEHTAAAGQILEALDGA